MADRTRIVQSIVDANRNNKRDVSLEDLAGLDGSVQVPADFLFADDTEQIGAICREVKLADDDLLTTAELAKTETYKDEAFIFGRSIEGDLVTLGEGDELELQPALLGNEGSGHITLLAETQSGKSQRFLIPALATWKGSAVVIDPKGTLASVTAERRGEGNSRYCEGMQQKVFVLDPRRVSIVPDEYFARFNPLTWLSENDLNCISKARSMADALIPDTDGGDGDTYWKDEGRELLTVVMTYVATDPDMTRPRTLNTVYELLQVGDEEAYESIIAENPDLTITPMSAFLDAMADSPVLDGYVSREGKSLSELLNNASKQWDGIRTQSKISLSWVAEKPMRDCLSATDFTFDQLRTNPYGVTVYVTVEDMARDWRWLRLISEIFLADSMAPTSPVRGQTLFILDEFPQMKRMRTMTKALAVIAEYGVRMCIVAQSLSQLKAKDAYPDEWKQILSSSRLRIFFGTECPDTAKYASELLGEKQIVSRNRSIQVSSNFNEGRSTSEGDTQGTSHTTTESTSNSNSTSTSKGGGLTEGESTSTSQSKTASQSANASKSKQVSYEEKKRTLLGAGRVPLLNNRSISRGKQRGEGNSVSQGSSNSQSHSSSRSENWSTSESSSVTNGHSESDTRSQSHTSTQTQSAGRAHGATYGIAEQRSKKSVLSTTDIIKHTAVIPDERDPRFPGQALIVLRGGRSALVRTLIYYEDEFFYRKFGAHPRYGFKQAPLPYEQRMEEQRKQRIALDEEQKRIAYEDRQQELVAQQEREAEARKILGLAEATFQRVVELYKKFIFEVRITNDEYVNLVSTSPVRQKVIINNFHYTENSQGGKIHRWVTTGSPLVSLGNGIPLIRMPRCDTTLQILNRDFTNQKALNGTQDVAVTFSNSLSPPPEPSWLTSLRDDGCNSSHFEKRSTLEEWTAYLEEFAKEHMEKIGKHIDNLTTDARTPFSNLVQDVDKFNNRKDKKFRPFAITQMKELFDEVPPLGFGWVGSVLVTCWLVFNYLFNFMKFFMEVENVDERWSNIYLLVAALLFAIAIPATIVVWFAKHSMHPLDNPEKYKFGD